MVIDKKIDFFKKFLVFSFWPLAFLFYDLLFLLGFTIYLPVYFWRKKISFSALKEKLGFISIRNTKKSIWIQVVSVGEVNLIGNLIKRLKEFSDSPIVISTTTLTGNKIAKEKYSKIANVIFLPLDISFILKKILKVINPKIFIAIETEIWPNLIWRLNRENIPTIIINGRISDKAFRQYKLIKPLMRKILARYSYISVQNQMYMERFIFLGADSRRAAVSGNMKFEGISLNSQTLLEIKKKYKPVLKKGDVLLLLAASTHNTEEEIIIDIYKDIRESLTDFNLIIAPRHPERTLLVEKIIQSRGFNSIRLSKLGRGSCEKNKIFVIDTVGELLYLYSIADICFVGGSLSQDGGHNILEPIFFSKPTVFGPNMNNFRDIEEAVLEKGAGLKVKDAEELKKILLRLLNDSALRENLRKKCIDVFEKEKKGLENNLKIILNHIPFPHRNGLPIPVREGNVDAAE